MSRKTKLNCWEFKKCGREPGGYASERSGICAAAVESKIDGINGGINGGRACWAVSGTFCVKQVQGSFATKLISCLQCDFYKKVLAEEGADYKGAADILKKMKHPD